MTRRLLTSTALSLGLGLLLFPACGDKDGDDTGTSSDGGATDGGTTDGGTTDGGTTDGGTTDGGTTDGGTTDGGTTDGGTTVMDDTIYDMQSGALKPGATVTLEDVVVSSPQSTVGFFIAEEAGGPNSGVWVYHGYSSGVKVNQGDLVDIVGIVAEYADASDETGGTVTELELTAKEFLTVTGTGTVPEPTSLTLADLADPTTAEAYEGVLVRVADLTVTETGLSGGEWVVNDTLIVDDLLYDFPGISVGDTFTAVQGVVHYGYGNYKIEPRSDSDFEGYVGVPCPAEKCPEDLAVGDLVITEVLFDPQTGDDDDCEWIEIYNATGGTVELQGLVVGDDDTSTGEVSGSAIMESATYAVIAKSTEADWAVSCAAMYGVMEPLGWYGSSPNLSNSGDPVEVRRPDGVVVDGIPSYDTAGDGWQLDAGYLDAASNDDSAYWCQPIQVLVKFEDAIDYGTPGEANDICVGD